MSAARILVVANRTATDPALLEAVGRRADAGPARFHLVVPATPRGLHRVVDPEVAGIGLAEERLAEALPGLCEAAGQEVTGHIGDADPLAAIQDALNLRGFDEIIISTLPRKLSRWLRTDLPSKARGLGRPVEHVVASRAEESAGLVASAV